MKVLLIVGLGLLVASQYVGGGYDYMEDETGEQFCYLNLNAVFDTGLEDNTVPDTNGFIIFKGDFVDGRTGLGCISDIDTDDGTIITTTCSRLLVAGGVFT